MIYKELKKSKVKVSRLGFGCMRLPTIEKEGKVFVDDEKAFPLLHRAYELGINYFDTAWTYCGEDGERAVGHALKPFRERVFISTKLPMWYVSKPDDFWVYLENALKRMDTDYIDFYHFHSVNRKFWNVIKDNKLLDHAYKAKSQGYIRHIAFSFHDSPELLKEIADRDVFESVLCQYSLLNIHNEEAIKYAKDKGLGVFIMGPLAGGNLTSADKKLMDKLNTDIYSPAELGLKFVWGNNDIDCALSGMENLKVLEENIGIEAKPDIEAETWQKIRKTAGEIKDYLEVYCTDCQYCFVCPKNIKPSHLFRMYNNWKTWGLKEAAKIDYNRMLTNEWWFGNRPDKCIECGACEKKCPQKLEIPKLLKKIASEFEELSQAQQP